MLSSAHGIKLTNETIYQLTEDVGVIREIIDKLYESPENSLIYIEYMVGPAQMKLRGRPSKDVERELEMLRSYFHQYGKPDKSNQK